MLEGEAPARTDLVLRGGSIIDGTGKARYRADLAIDNGRIVAIGDLGRTAGTNEMDASDRIVAPGFIDVHTHDDGLLLVDPGMSPKVSQGVTSVVIGNCGFSLAPLAPRATLPQEFRKYLGASGFGVGVPTADKKFVSRDGTVRYLMRFVDGESVETVWMPEGDEGVVEALEEGLRLGVLQKRDAPCPREDLADPVYLVGHLPDQLGIDPAPIKAVPGNIIKRPGSHAACLRQHR